VAVSYHMMKMRMPRAPVRASTHRGREVANDGEHTQAAPNQTPRARGAAVVGSEIAAAGRLKPVLQRAHGARKYRNYLEAKDMSHTQAAPRVEGSPARTGCCGS
jgi:hypothetical protein